MGDAVGEGGAFMDTGKGGDSGLFEGGGCIERGRSCAVRKIEQLGRGAGISNFGPGPLGNLKLAVSRPRKHC
jgi:hypothetical protein